MARSYGEGSIILRGRIWHLQYSHRGQVFKESSRSTDRKVATRLLRKRLSEVAAGRHAPAAEKVTLADLRTLIEDDHRLNQRRAERPVPRAFRHLEAYFGGRARAVDITGARLAAFAAARQKAGAAPATFRYELAILARCYRLAIRGGLLHTMPPFPQIRLKNARTGWVSASDIAAIIKELPKPLQPVVRFAYITGWRLASEVMPLCWAQVTDGEVRLEVNTTKSGEGRTFPVAAHPDLADLIEQQRAYTREVERRTGQIVPWVFHRDGRQIRASGPAAAVRGLRNSQAAWYARGSTGAASVGLGAGPP